MKRNSSIFILAFTLLCVISSCHKTVSSEENNADQSNETYISSQQFKAEGMEIGEITTQSFHEVVACKGYLASPTTGIAHVSTRISGVIEDIECIEGEQVKKGQVLCTIVSTELIKLQQSFVETGAKLKLLASEYARKKALYDEQISAEKEIITAESNYKIMEAKYEALKLQLGLLHLNLDKIESGVFYAQFQVLSPIKGNITSMNMVIGQYVDLKEKLLEIVDVNQLQVRLSVFAGEVLHLKVGQSLSFKTTGESDFLHKANIISVGKSIDPISKSITCIASIHPGETSAFQNNAFVEAQIITETEMRKAVPISAISTSANSAYLLEVREKADGFVVYKIPIKVSAKNKAYAAIETNKAPKQILVKGLYNLPLE